MTAIYHSKNDSLKRRRLLVGISTIAGLLLVVFLAQFLFSGVVSNIALSVGGPVSSVYLGVSERLSLTSAFLRSRLTLSEENRNLRKQIDELESRIVRLDSIEKEYYDLISLYGRTDSRSETILGNVVAKPPQSPYDTLIIDAGKVNSVEPGYFAYAPGGLPLGRVDQVSADFSRVVAFSNVGEITQAVIERTGSALELSGIGGGNMQALVSQDLDVEIKDMILLPQFGGQVVGEVISVESRVTGATKELLIRLPANIFNLRWVELVRFPEFDENNF